MEKDLQNEEARKKLKELVEDIQICMFASADTKDDKYGRPMYTMQVDDEGTIWFFTKENKKITADAKQNDKVVLYYAHPGKNSYLTIKGMSEAVKDRKKMQELYSPAIKGWFPKGLDEPDIILLKVTPEQAHYWDAEHVKVVVLFSMLKAAITGEQSDMGKTGDLKL